MASSLIVPFLVALLAPATAEPPASTTASDPLAPAEATPEATAPEAAEPEPAASEPAPEAAPTTPTDVPNPFAAPPPTAAAAIPPPTPAPPPPARPIRWRLDVGLGGGGTIVRDPGLRAFADGRHAPDVGVSTVFDFRLAEGRFFLGGGLAYRHVTRKGDAYGSQLRTEMQLDEPQVLGRVSFMAVEGVDAFARVGVGPSFAFTQFQSDGFEDAEQKKVLPLVDARAGLSLYLPKAWLPRKQASRVTAGLDVGLGYTWRGKLEVQPPLVLGDDQLPATTARWGALSLHGLCWGVGVFVRVM